MSEFCTTFASMTKKQFKKVYEKHIPKKEKCTHPEEKRTYFAHDGINFSDGSWFCECGAMKRFGRMG